MSVTFDATSLTPVGLVWLKRSHTKTWQHTATGSNLCAVVTVLVRRNQNIDPTVEAVYGNTELPSLGRVWLAGKPWSETTHTFIELFAAPVEAGEADVTVTITSGTAFAGEYRAACSTYAGVGRVGGYTAAYGDSSGDGMEVTTSSLSGRMVVAAFAHESWAAVSDYSGSKRQDLGLFLSFSDGAVGDAAGAAVVTMSAERTSGRRWCAAALDLIASGEDPDLVQGATPVVEVAAPPRVRSTEIPVLMLAPAFAWNSRLEPTVLRGEFHRYPYVPVKVPYINLPAESFAAGGKNALDNYLNRYTGQRILVVGYSMGAQVVYKWLRENGEASSVDPTEVTFICIGNPERKYNGYPDGGDYPGGEGGSGLPSGAWGYRVIDIATQYDFWADHPDDTDNTTAMRNVDPLGLLGNGNPMHGSYEAVSANPDHPRNFAYVEDTVTYVWCPTYPAPIVNDNDFFASVSSPSPTDEAVRDEIEAAYERPVTLPGPPPGGVTGGQFGWGWDTETGAWVRMSSEQLNAPSPLTWWLELEEGS